MNYRKYLFVFFVSFFLNCHAQNIHRDKVDSPIFDCIQKSFTQKFKNIDSSNKVTIGNICESDFDIEIRICYEPNLWASGSWQLLIIKAKKNTWFLEYYQRKWSNKKYVFNKIIFNQTNSPIKIDSIYQILFSNNIFLISDPFGLLDSMKIDRPGDRAAAMFSIGAKKGSSFHGIFFSNIDEYLEATHNAVEFKQCKKISRLFNDLYAFLNTNSLYISPQVLLSPAKF